MSRGFVGEAKALGRWAWGHMSLVATCVFTALALLSTVSGDRVWALFYLVFASFWLLMSKLDEIQQAQRDQAIVLAVALGAKVTLREDRPL